MASSAACDDVGVLRGFVGMFGNILRHRRLIYRLPDARTLGRMFARG